MSLARRWVQNVFAVLLVMTAGFAVPQGTVPHDQVPRFPEYRGQTLGTAVAEWTLFHGHKIRFSTSRDGALQDITDPGQLRLLISGNHPQSPPGTDLGAGDMIGVVVFPVRFWDQLSPWWLIIAILLGLAFGWIARGLWKAN